MGKNSKKKSRKNRTYNPPAPTNTPRAKRNQGPPRSLIVMLAVGFVLVTLVVLFSDRTDPTVVEGEVAADARADAAAVDTNKAAKDKKTQTKPTKKGSEPNSLLASIDVSADTFDGDKDKADKLNGIIAKTSDFKQYRAALVDAEKLRKEVAEGPGAAEVSAVLAWLQINTRNAAAANKTLDAGLSDPGDHKQLLVTLKLQAEVAGLGRGQAPSPELISRLESHLDAAEGQAMKATTAFNLAKAMEKAGRGDDAAKLYDQVASSYPEASEAPAALYSLGRYYESADDTAKAIAAYEAVVKNYPTAGEAKNSRQYAGQLKVIGKTGKDIPVQEWLVSDPGTLSEGMDGKVVLYVFWASWCPHCRKAMPGVVELHEKYKDDGLVVIGVTNLDSRQDHDKVTSYVAENSLPFPIAIQDGRAGSQYYAVGGIPAAALVDRNGVIRWRNHPAQNVEAMVKKLLAEEASSS